MLTVLLSLNAGHRLRRSRQAGKTYQLQTKWHPPVYHCSDQAVLKLRTHFALKLNGKLFIAYTTPAEKNYLPCK